MSDCNDTLKALETFLDGELTDDVRATIHSHIGGCHDCLETFEFHAELRQVISTKCKNDEMPPGLMAKIEQCLGADLDGDGQIG